jgi:cytochrome c oxidase subunit 2
MDRRARTAGAAGRERRKTLLRFGTILALVLMAAAALLPHAVSADNPYTHITPRTPEGRDIQGIYKLIFWMALVVFVGVQAGIAYTALRYRRRSEDDERPEQVHGNKTLEIAWTILPAIVLLAIFIPTVRTMYAEADDTKIEPNDVVIEVYGKQWWWEVHYKQPTESADVITANEIHVPQGKKVVVELYTNNVIHSFWVPQLIGKTDLIPGHVNKLAFTAEQNGYYWGQCAEFCGDSHTNMKFKVIIEPQNEFDAWVAAWDQGPTQLSAQVAGTGDVTKAPAAMAICAVCHLINKTNLNSAQVGLQESQPKGEQLGTAQTAGPNLTLFGCRTTIAGGIMDNTPDNLAKWLRDPASIKPGNYMASQIKKGTLSDQAIAEIVGYLESLKPDGGCPSITGEVLPETVASPAANETAVANAIAAAETAQAADATASAQASATAVAASATAAVQAAAQPTQPPAQGGQPPAQTTFEVDLHDISFDPKELTIPAGTDVTVNLVNKGATAHTFDIDALNIHSGEVQPGETKAITINAAAGDYQYYCAEPGHKEAGMVGTLHVVAGGGGAAPSGQAQNPPPASGGQAQAPTVNLEDIKFDPTAITIPANTPVTVTLVNKGATAHTFDIDALNVHSGPVAPGATATVTITAAPGQYQYYCAEPGHKEAGMVGTLTVQ